MKYIVFSNGQREIPFIFPNHETHLEIATALATLPEYKSCRLVSAGEIMLPMEGITKKIVCCGKSTTLNIESRREKDAELIEMIDYHHGIILEDEGDVKKG